MQTLQDILRARLAADPRCHVGAIEEVGDGSLRITFGAIGKLDRVTIGVSGNDLRIVEPEVAGVPIAVGDGASADSPVYTLPVDPADHSKDVLTKIAADRAVSVDSGATKADIAAAINKEAGFPAE